MDRLGLYIVCISLAAFCHAPLMAAGSENNPGEYPERNVVVEEFGGLWCAWCPRGFVAFELMNERHPDFIGLSYHVDDVMAIPGMIPDPTVSYPNSTLDRMIECDPYMGDSDGGTFGIESLWERQKQEPTPFFIDARAYFTSSENDEVAVDAVVRSVEDLSEHEYRIEYVLVANGLTGTGNDWIQLNNYAGRESAREMEGMDLFIDAPSRVRGLVFNDIVVMNTGATGVEQSLPDVIENNAEYRHSYSFKLADAVNEAGKCIIQDYRNLHVVAMVIEIDGVAQYGNIMNAVKCGVSATDAIEEITSGSKSILSEEYYDLTGRKLTSGEVGICVRITRYDDGSVTVSKMTASK